MNSNNILSRSRFSVLTLSSAILWLLQLVLIFVKNMWLVSNGTRYGQALSIYSSARRDGMPWFANALLILCAIGVLLSVRALLVGSSERPRYIGPRICSVLSFLLISAQRSLFKKATGVGFGMLKIHFGAVNLFWLLCIVLFVLSFLCSSAAKKDSGG